MRTNRVWMADSTFVATAEGFLYLAFILLRADAHEGRYHPIYGEDREHSGRCPCRVLRFDAECRASEQVEVSEPAGGEKRISAEYLETFYNVSHFTFSQFLEDPNSVGKNLRAYISRISEEMREILVALV